MKIAYHNPWIDVAENQSFASLAIAARKLGIAVFACANHEEIEACNPDFVLSVSSFIPKMVDIPSYLTVHGPPGWYLETPNHLQNLLSYDGFLTISDSIHRFVKDLLFGVGRSQDVGFYYNTPQTTELRMDWSLASRRELRVVYVGSGWDRRLPEVLRELDRANIIRIFGPEAFWRAEEYESYGGPLPFDGLAPQRAYSINGMGLALLADRWWQEDVISNRLFEIASVGAVAICPDMPWTRKWFGDSVLYFDPTDTLGRIAGQIQRHYEFCCAKPSEAQSMAEAAREVFEKHFACDKLLANLVEYHEKTTAQRVRRRSTAGKIPEIAVIVRCGGRPISYVKRAIDSIRAQSFGRFVVICAKWADIDLSSLTSDLSGAVQEFIEVSIPGAGRTEALFAGISRASTPYFAVLDDDDFWLSDHFEDLFRAGRQVRDDFDVAFSGSVAFDSPVYYQENLVCTRNISLFGFSGDPDDALAVASAIGTNCFVARRDLLTNEMLQVPAMDIAEDSVLIALLARRSKPIFSYRATAFHRRNGSDCSDAKSDRKRARDEVSLALRAGLAWQPEWIPAASFKVPAQVWRTTGLPALPRRKEDKDVLPPPEQPAEVTENSQRIVELETKIRELMESRSWRMTAPLRALGSIASRMALYRSGLQRAERTRIRQD